MEPSKTIAKLSKNQTLNSINKAITKAAIHEIKKSWVNLPTKFSTNQAAQNAATDQHSFIENLHLYSFKTPPNKTFPAYCNKLACKMQQ